MPAERAITHSISFEDLEKGTLGGAEVSTSAVLGFFQQGGSVLESAFDLDELLRGILDLTFEMLPVESGFILLADPDNGEMQVRSSKSRQGEASGAEDATKLSTTILEHATKQGRAVLTADATADRRFATARSVITQRIRDAMCVPLRGREDILGAIYVDSRAEVHRLTVDHLKLLTAVGAQLGIAVENTRLYEANLKAERLAALGQTAAGAWATVSRTS